MPDGAYRFGALDIEVEAGVARLTDGGSLAGSTLTAGGALRRAVNEIGLSVEDAVQAAASTPAALLGVQGRAGVISPGADADLIVCGDNMELAAVMVHGTWVDGAAPRP
jgi:N-acetylglucosamine-6-phosphate deacetylase